MLKDVKINLIDFNDNYLNLSVLVLVMTLFNQYFLKKWLKQFRCLLF